MVQPYRRTFSENVEVTEREILAEDRELQKRITKRNKEIDQARLIVKEAVTGIGFVAAVLLGPWLLGKLWVVVGLVAPFVNETMALSHWFLGAGSLIGSGFLLIVLCILYHACQRKV